MKLFLDIETQNDWRVEGFSMKDMRISYVGVIDDNNKEYDFWEDEMDKLAKILESASEIVTYNGFGFDMPIIGNYIGEHVKDYPQLDLMHAAFKTLGWRPKLNDLAAATLGYGKNGSGEDAVRYYANGELELLKKYCLMDVKITKEVYEFGRDLGYIKYFDKKGFVKEIAIDWELGRKKSKINKDLISMF